jgi:hypothetical protein
MKEGGRSRAAVCRSGGASIAAGPAPSRWYGEEKERPKPLQVTQRGRGRDTTLGCLRAVSSMHVACQQKRWPEPPRSLAYRQSRSPLGIQKKKPRKIRAGQAQVCTRGRGTIGEEPPSRDTNPRDCPKFRLQASPTGLRISWTNTSSMCLCTLSVGSPPTVALLNMS